MYLCDDLRVKPDNRQTNMFIFNHPTSILSKQHCTQPNQQNENAFSFSRTREAYSANNTAHKQKNETNTYNENAYSLSCTRQACSAAKETDKQRDKNKTNNTKYFD